MISHSENVRAKEKACKLYEQAGWESVVFLEFNTSSFDELDYFTDSEIKRMPEVEEKCRWSK